MLFWQSSSPFVTFVITEELFIELAKGTLSTDWLLLKQIVNAKENYFHITSSRYFFAHLNVFFFCYG